MLINKLKYLHQKKTFKNLFHLGFENVFRLLVNFILSVIVARSLGPNDYGKFTLVITYSTIFIPFFLAGIEDISVKLLIENREDKDQILGSAFLIRIFFGIISLSICYISFNFYTLDSEVRFYILAYMLSMTFHSFGVINNYYQSNIEESKTSSIRVFSFAITSILKVVTLIYSKSWIYFVYISCFELIFSYILMIIHFSFSNKILNWRFTKKYIKKLLEKGYPFLLILFCDYGLQRIDQLLIGLHLTPADLSFYAIPVKLIALWSFVPIIISSTSFPRITEYLKTKNYVDYNKSVSKTYSFILFFSLALSIGTSIISKFLIISLYGNQFAISVPILMVYCWVPLVSFFHYTRIKIFIANNKTALALCLSLATIILNYLLNSYFIPIYGIIASAYIAIFSFIIANILILPFSSFLRSDTMLYLKSPFYLKRILNE